jgi:hypothetical protein
MHVVIGLREAVENHLRGSANNHAGKPSPSYSSVATGGQGRALGSRPNDLPQNRLSFHCERTKGLHHDCCELPASPFKAMVYHIVLVVLAVGFRWLKLSEVVWGERADDGTINRQGKPVLPNGDGNISWSALGIITQNAGLLEDWREQSFARKLILFTPCMYKN